MQKKQAVSILDLPVHPLTMEEAITFIQTSVQAQKPVFVVTANAEILMLAQDDPAYKELLQTKADLVLPDGAGTVWGGRTLGYDIPERVAGYDLFLRLLDVAAHQGWPVYFFGGAPGIAEAAAATGRVRYPGLKVAGTHNGYFTEEQVPEIVAAINASGAQLLFAALGAPKQEKWLAAQAEKLQPCLRMGIGGSFDVLAGKVKRAPAWMQEARLEWLYRLLKQPSRFTRMLALPQFVVRILTAKHKKD
ncbi:MAG: WecB/TagA/CpsF family glycosyltransferase [Acidaminococcaceae bacterium]|nr:WecB/TagA/CpsF family glycosyltransferase [Acidaminococcaceae bacterium]